MSDFPSALCYGKPIELQRDIYREIPVEEASTSGQCVKQTPGISIFF
jgi:hypothetical protein